MPILAALATLTAVILIFAVLWDAFETIILPRRVRRQVRLTLFVYKLTWGPWAAISRRMRNSIARESFLSIFGPIALIFLLVVWAIALILGFGLLQWALESPLIAPEQRPGFGTYLYLSGTTFFTVGFGDVVPQAGPGRLVAVVEGGTGFGFLALVIGYLPVLYQAFSRREVSVSLLDARAGSPPSAGELLHRHGADVPRDALPRFLYDWERWCAELLESHLSYPSLSFFRSQHDNQSWLDALTVVLDACALVLAGVDDIPTHQARLTFAMARHAAVDLSQILGARPLLAAKENRLPPRDLARLRALLAEAGMQPHDGPEADKKLAHLRVMYEPYVAALAELLVMPLPPWLPPAGARDDWQTSPEE